MKKNAALQLLILLFILPACNRIKPVESYHPFTTGSWQRFDILKFEIPAENAGKYFDVLFFARFTHDFSYDQLNINMVLNTPAGEERINEYTMKVKSAGGKFLGEWTGDSCFTSMVLKRGFKVSSAGILVIEIENLTPRLQTEGILGAGIRLLESRQ
jgi:gliding motility-associated lipoprotein GldH